MSKKGFQKKHKKPQSLKKRNPLSLNPLMKKSHVHDKPLKSKRSQTKQKLKKLGRDYQD